MRDNTLVVDCASAYNKDHLRIREYCRPLHSVLVSDRVPFQCLCCRDCCARHLIQGCTSICSESGLEQTPCIGLETSARAAILISVLVSFWLKEIYPRLANDESLPASSSLLADPVWSTLFAVLSRGAFVPKLAGLWADPERSRFRKGVRYASCFWESTSAHTPWNDRKLPKKVFASSQSALRRLHVWVDSEDLDTNENQDSFFWRSLLPGHLTWSIYSHARANCECGSRLIQVTLTFLNVIVNLTSSSFSVLLQPFSSCIVFIRSWAHVQAPVTTCCSLKVWFMPWWTLGRSLPIKVRGLASHPWCSIQSRISLTTERPLRW